MAMTPEEAIKLSFSCLCRRLLDIDPKTSELKGCPYEYAGAPMFFAWRREQDERLLPPEAVNMLSADDGGGRYCPMDSMQHYAQQFLQRNTP